MPHTLGETVAAVRAVTGARLAPRRPITDADRVALYLAREYADASTRELAAGAGLSQSTVAAVLADVRRRLDAGDVELRTRLRECEEKLATGPLALPDEEDYLDD